ncbi:MAG: RHS repeat-associated core domain-containing protein [Opitutales bacterium]|nr:RHS repeat-associated core domain-containing protein [Opitutales bacterium]
MERNRCHTVEQALRTGEWRATPFLYDTKWSLDQGAEGAYSHWPIGLSVEPQRNPAERSEGNGVGNYGFRMYQPATGRFISRDPIREEGGLNLYQAFAGDPVNRTDFLGLLDEGLLDQGWMMYINISLGDCIQMGGFPDGMGNCYFEMLRPSPVSSPPSGPSREGIDWIDSGTDNEGGGHGNTGSTGSGGSGSSSGGGSGGVDEGDDPDEADDPDDDLPPCKWWQRAAARAQAVNMNTKIVGGGGVGFGVGYKNRAAKVEARVEAVVEFTYDNAAMRSTLGSSYTASLGGQIGPRAGGGSITLTEYYETDFSKSLFSPEVTLVSAHRKTKRYESLKGDIASLEHDTFGINATAGFIKAGFELNLDRINDDTDRILRDQYGCDPRQ